MTASPMLQATGLSVRRAGRTVLRDVSFAIAAGEWVTAIGPNGAGKSSLVRAITGEWPAAGHVQLFGRALRDWSREKLARQLGVMTQSERLEFGFTVREVVELGRLPHRRTAPSVNRRAVDEVLGALHLERFGDRPYTALSGGERQRVQFARVMAQIWNSDQPTLLILDEPTSALDLAQQRSVLDLAARAGLANGAVLAVLHDLNLAARYSSRLLLLSQGELVSDAAPADVLTHSGLARHFSVNASVERSSIDGAPIVLLPREASARVDAPNSQPPRSGLPACHQTFDP